MGIGNWFIWLVLNLFLLVGIFMKNAFLGLFQMIVGFQKQRFCTLLVIIFFVYLDLCFIAPDCLYIREACIHFLIILSPFIYLAQIGKKGEV